MTQLMTEKGMVRVPAGTWEVDPAHSSATSRPRCSSSTARWPRLPKTMRRAGGTHSAWLPTPSP
jgi:hypothetical protein